MPSDQDKSALSRKYAIGTGSAPRPGRTSWRLAGWTRAAKHSLIRERFRRRPNVPEQR